jgi:hypothetical protein
MRFQIIKRMTHRSTLAIVATLILAAVAQASDTFPMKAQTLIEIDSYDAATQTYHLTNIKYWGQGPLVTTPEFLVQAIPALNLKRIKKSPSSILRTQYVTDHDMILLMPKAIEARRKH